LTTDPRFTAIVEENSFLSRRHGHAVLLGPDETVQGAVADVGTLPRGHSRVLARMGPLPRDSVRVAGCGHSRAITLKLNVFEDTGAIIRGGDDVDSRGTGSGRNWDYRYCWLRDAYFVINALNRLSDTQTMERYLTLHLEHRRRRGSRASPARVWDQRHSVTDEQEVDSLPGYRGLGPVRIGNQAYQQVQHDVYGSPSWPPPMCSSTAG